MKKVLFVIGILILMLVILGVYSGDIVSGISAILWLPVTLFWDIPVVILPFTILLMAGVTVYGMVTKSYQKFYKWYRNLFCIIVFAVLALEIESLFRLTSFFKIPEYISFFVYFFLLLITIGFIAFAETKKDAGYYITANALVIIYLIIKFIYFVW